MDLDELEVYPIYTDAELERINAEFNTYIGERDDNTKWRKHKSLSAALFGLADHFPKLEEAYKEARTNLKLVEGTSDYITVENARDIYNKAQSALTRALFLMRDLRLNISQLMPTEVRG
jgi:hypothetical protein